MNLNFRDALATLSRALPLVLMRAGVFVAGGFMVIILFAMLLFASRLAAGAGQVVAVVIASLAVLGWWASGRVLQRFFLYRQRAAMLLAFSGSSTAAGGMAATIEESKRLIPDYPCWKLLNRALRPALVRLQPRRGSGIPGSAYRPGRRRRCAHPRPAGHGFARPGRPGPGLCPRRRGRRAVGPGGAGPVFRLWNRRAGAWRAAGCVFSAAGLLFLFLCLAVPNWFFFRSAGAPVWIGVVLAAAIARLLHQAFIVPFVLAGVSAALLAATRDRIPDPELCDRMVALFPDAAPAGRR